MANHGTLSGINMLTNLFLKHIFNTLIGKLVRIFCILIVIFIPIGCSPFMNIPPSDSSELSESSTKEIVMPHTPLEWTSLLVQSGDLPAFHIAGYIQILDAKQPILKNLPDSELLVSQWIGNTEQPDEQGGQIQLVLYRTSEAAEIGYQRMTSKFEGDNLNSVGQRAIVLSEQVTGVDPAKKPLTRIWFQRCRAVVELWGVIQTDPRFSRGMITKDDLIIYAKHLDERLQKIAC